MKFIGVDLTSAFPQMPRPVDVAVLEDGLNVNFHQVMWPPVDAVTNRDTGALSAMILGPIGFDPGERTVWAIDGPQGLAAPGQTLRACERILGTPGRTPCQLPPPVEGAPFQGYIRSSVDLFAALVGTNPPYRLVELNRISRIDANLFEVFPGAEWAVLAGRRLPNKATLAGREARRQIFERLGVVFPSPLLPSDDEHDALVGAYLAWRVHRQPETVELIGITPAIYDGEIREGFILHSTGTGRVDLPVQGEPPAAGLEEDGNRNKQPDQQPETDWNEDGPALLFLTDYGLVQGTEPENSWLVPGINYVLETQPPDIRVRFRLDHSTTFSGGRGWRADPTVKPLLAQLGRPTPEHLSRDNAVTLRVVVV